MVERAPNGYILNVPPHRREVLLRANADKGYASEPVDYFTHSKSYALLCFLSFEDGYITHVARSRGGFSAGSELRQLHLDDLTALSRPVGYQELLPTIPAKVRSHVQKRFIDGGLLPPASFGAFVDSLRRLLPESNSLLDRFSEARRTAINRLGEHTKRSLALQKDSLAIAFEFAEIDREQLTDWIPGEAEPVGSFLDGLPKARLREDQMLLQDFQNFPGLAIARTMQHGAAVFVGRGVRLTVVMANRQPLEKQTGADLIYRNETYGSFVIVQYKAMEDEPGGAKFRLPNQQLTDELARMDQLAAELLKHEPDAKLSGFRLATSPFFLKLCPRVVFDPDNKGLIPGMYLPLDYWRRLENDPCIEGKKEGKAVDFSNAGRYFSNSTFAPLVAHGWIGTSGMQTSALDALIREIVESGRTVTIAVKETIPLAEWNKDEVDEIPMVEPIGLSDLRKEE